MGEITGIQWTDHTWNTWRGCSQVSPGCDNCYAETMSKRNPAVLGVWGDEGTRVVAAEAYWQLPHKWNRQAEREGRRHRVFCLSLGDWLEDRPELIMPRARLLYTIARTPHLDWQLLTKRPAGWRDRMTEIAGMNPAEPWSLGTVNDWLYRDTPPANVWLGVSVEDQKAADERIPHLLRAPAAVRFLSCEPLLGPLDLRHIDADGAGDPEFCQIDALTGRHTDMGRPCPHIAAISWVITGGESGPGARPANPNWFRDIRDQCRATGVAYFHKQNGEYVEWDGSQSPSPSYRFTTPDATPVVRVGKHTAGRLLDGHTWDEFPSTP